MKKFYSFFIASAFMMIVFLSFSPTTGLGQNYQSFDASTTNAWTASKWSAASATNACVSSGLTNAFSSGSIVYLCTVNGTGSGSVGITIGGITATENYTHSSPSGTLLTGGNVVSINVSSGKTFDLSTAAISTAAGTGFNKTGAGGFALAGGTYTGGFTLSNGTVILRGVNAMGSGGALTINGGTIAANATRDLTGKYTGGITIGGDFTLGSGTSPAVASSNLTFSNNASLGSNVTRTITIGGTGSYTFSGIISGSNSGLTVNNTAAGTLILSGANTYSGVTTVTGGTLQLNKTGGTTLPSTNNITVNGGILKISSNQTLNDLNLSSGTLTVDPGITLTINGAFTYTGGTITNNGTIAYGASGSLTYGTGGAYSAGTEWPSANPPANITIQTSGTAITMPGARTISTLLSIASGTSLDAGTNAISGASLVTSGTGTLKTQNTSATPLPTGKTWTMDVEYNSASGQTVMTGTYAKLSLLNGGTKTAEGAITTNGNFVTDASSSLSAGTFTHTVKGNWSNAGTLSAGTSRFIMNGSSGTQTMSGSTFYNLEINNSGSGVQMLTSEEVSNTLFLTTGTLDLNSNTLTMDNGSTISRAAGSLSAAPVFGSAGTDRVNVTITATNTSDNELLGTTGGIGTLTITTGTYTLGVSPTVDNLSIAASQTLDAADKVITPRASGAVTVNGTLKTANLNGFSGAANTAINNTNSPTITLGAASTIEYNAAAGTQTVDGRTDYVNLTLSGNADKNISTGAEVSGNFTVSGSGTTTPPTTMTFDGASAQSIAGLVYTNVAFSGAGTKTFNSDGSLQGAMTFASGTGTIDFDGSGDNKVFTLKSNATGTARIGNTNSNSATLTGNVGVERYIPSSRRAWRLLTAPMTGSSNNSVYYNWQNNGTPGSGFEMWSPAGGNGLTTGGGNTSIRKYTATGWVNISNTQTEQLFSSSTNNAFAVFVTGTYGSGNISTGFAAATAKGTGTLRSGDITFAGLLDTKHNLVGNPYASPIDIDAVLSDAANNTKFDQFVWLWDPAINSFGGYVTYDVTVNSYTASTNYPADVQSGQAFFVKATGGTQTLTIKESQKTAGSTNNVYRSNTVAEIFKTAMYRLDATPLLLDAVMNAYNAGDNAAVDNGDAAKFSNTGENLSIIRDGAYLSIEHRPLVNLNDTIYLQVWNMQQANYRFTFEALNMSSSGLVAYLEDAFLNTSTPLSLNGNTVNVDFTVTASALSTGDRFRIVFRPASALPVTITNIKAYEKGATIAVEWTSLSESNIDHYDVERSADGRNFTTLSAVHAKGNIGLAVNYQLIDADPLNGNNYYRIKIVGASAADVKYTSVVKVNRQKGTEGIGVYPNPVKGDAIQLQLNNIKKGTYTLTLYNNLGERVLQKVIQHNGGAAVETIALNSGIASGVYILKLAGSEMNVQQRIIIERP